MIAEPTAPDLPYDHPARIMARHGLYTEMYRRQDAQDAANALQVPVILYRSVDVYTEVLPERDPFDSAGNLAAYTDDDVAEWFMPEDYE